MRWVNGRIRAVLGVAMLVFASAVLTSPPAEAHSRLSSLLLVPPSAPLSLPSCPLASPVLPALYVAPSVSPMLCPLPASSRLE